MGTYRKHPGDSENVCVSLWAGGQEQRTELVCLGEQTAFSSFCLGGHTPRCSGVTPGSAAGTIPGGCQGTVWVPGLDPGRQCTRRNPALAVRSLRPPHAQHRATLVPSEPQAEASEAAEQNPRGHPGLEAGG